MVAAEEHEASRPTIDRVEPWVFYALLAAVGGLLLWYGNRQWFFLDEWSVLTDRPMPSIDSVLRAHNGHWIALNVVAYKINFWLFGLHSYFPYQLPTVLLHLGIALMLRRTMMRYGVRHWIAAAIALTFALFGTGHENIVSAFQISLNGSVFLGLVYLELVDRDGPWVRRDWVAMLIGFLCLTTSGVAIPMIAGASAAIALRRGIPIAAKHSITLGAIYGTWYLAYASDSGPETAGSPGAVLRFVADLAVATANGLAQYTVTAVLLGLVFGVGMVGYWIANADELSDTKPTGVLGLVVAFLVFALLIGYSRVGVAEAAGIELDLGKSSRYRHVSAALLLPTLGLGTEWLARRQVWLAIPVLAALAAGIPGNLDTLDNRLVLGNERQIALLAHSEIIDQVPPSRRPVSAGILGRQDITAGWLSGAAASGKIDPPEKPTKAEQLTAFAALALEQRAGNELSSCQPLESEVSLTLQAGEALAFAGTIRVRVVDGETAASPLIFAAGNGRDITALTGPFDITVAAVNDSAALC